MHVFLSVSKSPKETNLILRGCFVRSSVEQVYSAPGLACSSVVAECVRKYVFFGHQGSAKLLQTSFLNA